MSDRTHHHPNKSLITTPDDRESMDENQGYFGDYTKLSSRVSCILSFLLLTFICVGVGDCDGYEKSSG